MIPRGQKIRGVVSFWRLILAGLNNIYMFPFLCYIILMRRIYSWLEKALIIWIYPAIIYFFAIVRTATAYRSSLSSRANLPVSMIGPVQTFLTYAPQKPRLNVIYIKIIIYLELIVFFVKYTKFYQLPY